MVKNFGSRLRVEFQLLSSRVFSVPTHWVGRSVPCAGDDCPMCALRQPRELYFAGLRFERASAIFELPSSVAHAINMAWHDLGGDHAAGIVVLLSRAGGRAEWNLQECSRQNLLSPKVSQPQVAAAVAELYRLAKPAPAEDFVAWFERARVGQALTLQNCVLPFGGENSSHRIAQAARN